MHVLIVEDNASVARSLADSLNDLGLNVTVASSAEQAIIRVGAEPPDLVLSDVRMPGMNGMELLSLLRGPFPLLP
jgi:CheY-like chemotaxis protein